jgi:zinc-binding alcohol dehydrogenase family protein
MKTIGYQKSLTVTETNALVEFDAPKPVAIGQDILVKIEAISVNPVDTKVRSSVTPEAGEYKVLGWDASGIVETVGEQVSLFQPGDRVWYAGAINRSGSNAEYHLVDERIVSKMPETLSFSEAAALPLTAITAWEILFERFGLNTQSTGTLLIIGAAGGVGSIMIQLAKKLTQLQVIATASRQETRDWVELMGADEIINHHQPLPDELKRVGVESANYVASLTHTGEHLTEIVEVITPQGKMAVIDDPATLDIMPFKHKSVSVHWELMFTRSLFETVDMIEQHKLLARVAAMVDEGELISTRVSDFGGINAANVIRAHALLESGKSMGKIVLSGF